MSSASSLAESPASAHHDATAPKPLTAAALRSAFGHFATGVTIVTCQDAHGRRAGLTVNSFGSLSLDPPLVLWSLRHASPSLAAFDSVPHFAVNVLGAHQIDVSRRFSSGARDRFDVGGWSIGLGGAPVLDDCVAAFECQLVSRQDAGDHVLYIGRVLRLRESKHAPLVYHSGRYRVLGNAL